MLIIAGSDSGGGAGIQADIKTVTMFGGYASTAITALTAQNSLGVAGIHEVPAEFVCLQMAQVLDDIGADAIKTGMLNTAEIILAVAQMIESKARELPLVVDPVMVAKGGAALLQADAVHALVDRLLPLAHILTPNIPEAEALTGITIGGLSQMRDAAKQLLAMGCGAILLKGGHMEGDMLEDLLLTHEYEVVFSSPRVLTMHTHGTGCTLASAIAAGLAQGHDLRDAVQAARDYVQKAIQKAPGFGHGHGPINHLVTP